MTLQNIVRYHGLSASLLLLACSATGRSAAADVADLGVAFPVNGVVKDMRDHTSALGLTFKVRFRDISYDGRVNRVLLECHESSKMTVWLAFRDFKVTIRRTDITGSRHRANCGPLTIVMGDRSDAWLAFDVDQEEKDNQIALTVEKTRFSFTRDNWRVGSPSWVRTSGLGMTQGRVVDGLRSGLKGRRDAFEQQIIEIAPSMFVQVATHVKQHLSEKAWQHETVALK